MPLKIQFREEKHVLKSIPTQFNDLLSFIQKTFKCLPKSFQLYYKDQDGDKITISCVEDLRALQEFSKYPRVVIEPSQENTLLINNDEMSASKIFSDVDEFQFIKEFIKQNDEKTVEPKKDIQVHYFPK